MKITGAILFLVIAVAIAQAQLIPGQYTVNTVARSVNGSSSIGHCLNILANTTGMHTCSNTTSSVLFDGIIPTLTGLYGDMWATQLLTIRSKELSIINSFAQTQYYFPGVRRVEMALFNCPEWGISVQSITLLINISTTGTINPNITSCDSLVRVCIGDLSTNPTQTDLTLQFTPIRPIDWMHIAEVTFYGAGPTCPGDTAITIPTPPPSTTTPPPDITITTPSPDITNKSLPSATLAELTTHPEKEQCPSSTILASVLTAISTALLTTVIFVLVQIALCKCRPKATAGSAPSIGGEGLAEYEELDVGGERGVAGSDPTYMEVGTGGGGSNTMELEENKAYGVF